ncbi:urate hydroxylase PuuD [Roseiterribacter gracilis]|uniref:Membrane protein n=1 Tax=Roseiterribacter gracilis TaxID=2812848 RepID=A0A8S8X6J8_9PROT|nr:membrane protein [Rhodospirillales bacterium TMPK1]
MGNILGHLYRALTLGVFLLVVVILGLHAAELASQQWIQTLVRVLHVWVGILWIGLLYYFNFVQIPTMPKVPAELKPAVSKFIAPEALFWFRWAALGTVLAGLLLAHLNPYGVMGGLTFSNGGRTIGIGMWLGIIMAANVWFFIWPNQQKALGLVPAEDAAKAAAARTAMLFSRTNFVLSFPMLYCMIAQQNIG